MEKETRFREADLEKYRPYLRTLARLQSDPRDYADADPSDLAQQTLIKGHRHLAQFRGTTEAALRAWLRAILAQELAGLRRDQQRGRRLPRDEVRVLSQLEASSMRLTSLLADEQDSPSERVIMEEELMRISEALESLPEGQRQALELHYLREWTVTEIADHMQQSRPTVAGLLRRGLKELRRRLRRDH